VISLAAIGWIQHAAAIYFLPPARAARGRTGNCKYSGSHFPVNRLTHVDEQGRARMVDVTAKGPTERTAVARGKVVMKPSTLALIADGGIPKGDVIGVARIAGIMAAKETGRLIPMCHPLELTGIDISFADDRERGEIEIEARVKTVGRTGVEMEALTAVTVAALTIYDMCKAADREMTITDIMLTAKKGGKSGAFVRKR